MDERLEVDETRHPKECKSKITMFQASMPDGMRMKVMAQ